MTLGIVAGWPQGVVNPVQVGRGENSDRIATDDIVVKLEADSAHRCYIMKSR